MRIAVIVLALLLGGCTSAQQAALSSGIEAARQAKDAEAQALKAGTCLMSIGSYHRVNSDAEKRALDVLCGGDWERPVTADDVRRARELLDIMRPE